jgi:uncharacterized protein
VDLDPVELRVLGCLIEKQRTTPDQYPLSVNSLRLACNQSTSRDPVVDWDEPTVRDGIQRLSHRGWIRLASGPGSRAAKYRHLLDSELDLDDAELSVLAVLMLRGPQTAAEISQRTDRLHSFGPGEVDETLERLAGRELVGRRPPRPGQRGDRYAQLLGAGEGAEPAAAAHPSPPHFPENPSLEARVARLEAEIAELRERLT